MTRDERHEPFDARLDLVPTSPGVYLMKDTEGSVIYVGKAINLRSRLTSYFTPNPKGTLKVMMMIEKIRDFDFLVCRNELEALVLESNLIKQYQPFYNILLKDDHDYPYIKVTMNELYPRVLKAYRIGPDQKEGALYFGPYLNGDVNRAIQTLHELFPMKTCRREFPRDVGKERPCLNYYIHRCIGPCLGDVSAEDYRVVMQEVVDFLAGRYTGIIGEMKTQMQAASEALEFEKAARIRDRIQSLEVLSRQQTAVSAQRYDADALGIARSPVEICILKLEVRDGKISGTSTFFFDTGTDDDAEILTAFMSQYYPQAAMIPRQILLGTGLEAESQETLERTLGELAGRRVSIHLPERGDKKQVLDLAMKNAEETLKRRRLLVGSSQEAIDEGLRLIGELTGCKEAPARIEAYDISNLGADDKACSMIVFTHGKASKRDYRQFKIKQVEGQDDYASLTEAIGRRLDRLGDEKFGRRPDLILVDGGLQHVAVIGRLLGERGLQIPLAGMVKDGRHRTRGLALASGEIVELGRAAGIADSGPPSDRRNDIPRLQAGSETGIPGQHADSYDESVARLEVDISALDREQVMRILRLLAAIQNEAHRFAGRYQQKLANKRQTKFKLETIPGIGPARRKALLLAMGSIKRISEASEAELLEQVPGLGQKQARAVFLHFHPEADEQVTEEGGQGV